MLSSRHNKAYGSFRRFLAGKQRVQDEVATAIFFFGYIAQIVFHSHRTVGTVDVYRELVSHLFSLSLTSNLLTRRLAIPMI